MIVLFSTIKGPLFVPKYIAHLRPTTPLRDYKIVDEALREFIDSQFSALRSCHQMTDSSYKSFEIEDSKLKRICNGGFDIEKSNNSRQSYPKTFEANGYIDVIRSETVQNLGILHGNNVKAFITERTYEIDDRIDVDIMNYFIEAKAELIKSMFS